MTPPDSRVRSSQQVTKRATDVALSLFAIGLFAPVQAAVWSLVQLEDGGPLLFTQERIGKSGRPFRIYKLRTMRDGEITQLGHWLRATGLDETPQFFNVLRGDMSIVGPRPLTVDDLSRLGWDRMGSHPRFAVRPGITGLAQVFAGRGARHARALDALYSRVHTPWLDLRLIAVSFAMNVVGKARVKRWLRR